MISSFKMGRALNNNRTGREDDDNIESTAVAIVMDRDPKTTCPFLRWPQAREAQRRGIIITMTT